MANELSNAVGTEDEEDVIPESILSLSKDARYIGQCQALLENALAALLERKELLLVSDRGDPERQRELQQLRNQLAWWISCILYLMVSIKTGRTLGMEALGLAFSDERCASVGKSERVTTTTTTRSDRSRFAGALLMLAATGGLAWDYFRETQTIGNENNDGGDRRCPERLRGRERRQLHERLRQQMLARASDENAGSIDSIQEQPSQGARDTEQDTGISAASPSHSRRLLFVLRRLSKFMFQVYSDSDGPHDVVATGDDDDDDDETNANNRWSTLHSVGFWIVRLHLAQFLFTGNYPTLTHRFLGLKPRRQRTLQQDGVTGTTQPTTAILSRPNTNRVIGFVILLQASTVLVRNTSGWFARAAAKYLEARADRNGNRTKRVEVTNAELRATLEALLFGQRPQSQPNGAKLQLQSSSEPRCTPRVVCTICRSDRKHPAAPSSCGHVFCWQCLLQWVSTVRPECPLCRAPCSANDVIALHNYEYEPQRKQDSYLGQ